MNSVKAFARLLASAPRRWVTGLLALMVMSSLTEGFGLLLLVPMLGVLNGGAHSDNSVVRHLLEVFAQLGLPITLSALLSVFMVMIVLRSLVQYGRERLGAALEYRVVDGLRQRCFAALLGVEWRWIVAGRKSDHANLLLTDVSRVGVGLHMALQLATSLAGILVYLVIAITLSWAMALVAVATGGLVFALLSGQRRNALRLGHGLVDANRDMHSNVQESLAGIKLTKILGTEQRHLDYFMSTTRRLRDQQLRFTASTSLSKALFQVGGALLLALYLYVGLRVWHLPAAELLVLVLVFARLVPQLMGAQQQYYHWLHSLPALQEIDTLLDQCHSAAEPASAVDVSPLVIEQGICLHRVGLTYAGREQPALDAVSVCFPVRTTTAIIGPSGAGKSTLADLLMGLLVPDVGELRIDDNALDAACRMRWRRAVAYVPQEVFLFHDSVRNNLLWGCEQATEVELIEALKRAAADFVFDLPDGLDTLVGDGGTRLSGGERQRIALARALLNRPSLLILDEATSALDLDNEARVRQAIENLHGDLTVVIIGHRLPTLEHADRVIALDNGRISAQGSWQEVRAHLDAVEPRILS